MAKSSVHLNGNLFCAVDVETTGLQVGFHEIWQIAILPLDSLGLPSKEILPFYQDMRVNYPERINKRAIHLNRNDFALRQKRALDPFLCTDMLDEWFQRLNLPIYKKIVPLAHNWPFDRSFLLEWLGETSFHDFFHPHYRDSMATAIFLMDLASHKCNRVNITRFNLTSLCNEFKITNMKAHDALQDCIATAELYRRLLQYAS
jgi:DNA polymerase III alpha subunit (gram-positive type)